MCRRHSLVRDCGILNYWWYRSMFLGAHKITELHLTENDKSLLNGILLMELSEQAVESMKHNIDTQKNEAAHRSLHVSLPKSVNFSRNLKNALTHLFTDWKQCWTVNDRQMWTCRCFTFFKCHKSFAANGQGYCGWLYFRGYQFSWIEQKPHIRGVQNSWL